MISCPMMLRRLIVYKAITYLSCKESSDGIFPMIEACWRATFKHIVKLVSHHETFPCQKKYQLIIVVMILHVNKSMIVFPNLL